MSKAFWQPTVNQHFVYLLFHQITQEPQLSELTGIKSNFLVNENIQNEHTPVLYTSVGTVYPFFNLLIIQIFFSVIKNSSLSFNHHCLHLYHTRWWQVLHSGNWTLWINGILLYCINKHLKYLCSWYKHPAVPSMIFSLLKMALGYNSLFSICKLWQYFAVTLWLCSLISTVHSQNTKCFTIGV